MYLSKSQYLRGLQCHRALWLYRHQRELMAAVDSNREALFATGHEVGELAKSRFPGGVEIEFDPQDFDGMCARTAALMEQGVEVIYEATFCRDGLLAMADILQRNGDRWDFYEVKSSTRVKPYHLDDAAIQWHILSAHLTPARAHIVHINNRYRRSGELDLQQLFQIEDVTTQALQKQALLQTSVQAMWAMLDDAEPDTAIGMHCNNPFECDFKNHCWKDVPAESVFDLYQLSGERKFELYHQGLVHYQDLREIALSPTQALQLSTATSGQTHVERERIADFIGSAVFPIHFLDFETLQHAIPRFEGQRPYQQIPLPVFAAHSAGRRTAATPRVSCRRKLRPETVIRRAAGARPGRQRVDCRLQQVNRDRGAEYAGQPLPRAGPCPARLCRSIYRFADAISRIDVLPS